LERRESSLFLLYKKIAPFDAMIVPSVSLNMPEPTESIWSASIRISPSSLRDER